MKRKNLIIIKIILNVIALIFLVNLLVFFITGHSFSGPFISFFGTDSDYAIQKEKEYDIHELENLNFDFSSHDITFYPSENDKMKVVQKSRASLKENELYQDTLSGDTLTFRQTKKVGFYFFYIGKPSSKIEVYLPKDFSHHLSIKNVSGDIICESNFSVKNLTLGTTSGDITTKQCIAADSMKITSVSGNIKIEELISNSSLLKSTSGNIMLESFTSCGDILSTSGDIEISDLCLTNSSYFKTTSGRIRLHLAENFSSIIHASSVSGSLQLPDGSTSDDDEDGEYFDLKLNTISGDIQVTQ